MDTEEKIVRISRNVEEIVTVEELKDTLLKKEKPRAYIGFEPSGLVHVGTGLVCGNKIKDFISAGIEMTIFMADWHAYLNDKLGGSLQNIAICGRYMEECFTAIGIPTDKVRYVYASNIVDDKSYWEKVLKIAKNCTLSRIKRALTIMGRREDDAETDFSKLIYPSMQVADIFALDVDIAYGGMDQRKAHMLARDVAEKLNWRKPVAIHTPLLTGLGGGERMDIFDLKMSKSNPDSCILIHDTHSEIKRKIQKAYCRPMETKFNPIIEMCKYIIFPEKNEMVVERDRKFGGDVVLKSFEELSELYERGEIHPSDLKTTVVRYLDEILTPIRKYFDIYPENYQAVLKIQVTK